MGFRDGCDDCDGIFDTAPCCHFNRHNRHQSSHGLSCQADEATVAGTLHGVFNAVLIPQISCFDIEPAGQNVGLYILSKQGYKLRSAAVPYRVILGNYSGDLVQ